MLEEEKPERKRAQGRPRTRFDSKEQVDINKLSEEELDIEYKELKSRYESIAYIIDDKGVTMDIGAYMMRKGRTAKKEGKKFEVEPDLQSRYNERNRLTKVIALYKHALEGKRREKSLEFLDTFKVKITDYYAKGYTTRDIHEMMLENVKDVPISANSLEIFKDKYQIEISNKAKFFQDNLDDLPLTKKRRRVKELENLFYKFNKELKTNARVDYSQELRAILKQIKEECEGLTIKIDMDIKQAVEIHVMQEEIAGINPLQIVLANIAGKQGLSPEWFMARLSQSYYAKVNGFINPNIHQDHDGELLYPSDVLYDFDKLEGKAREIHEQDSKSMYLQKATVEITEAEVENITLIKDSFLQKLKEKLGKA